MALLVYLGLLAFTFFALRGFLVPYLLSRLTPIRINSISLRNIRGLEWHPRQWNGDGSQVTLKVARIGWEWCAKGHWGVSVVAEHIDVSLDQDLEAFKRMGKNNTEAKGGDTTEVPRMVRIFCQSRMKLPFDKKGWTYPFSMRQVKQQLMSQLKRYFQPVVLSFSMKYLPSILHLVRFHVSDIRVSQPQHSVVLLLDFIDATFDVNYEDLPVFVSPQSAMVPETPGEPSSPIPGSFSPLPSVDEHEHEIADSKDKAFENGGYRGWDALWRKVMGRATGQVDMTIVVSKCRLEKAMDANKQNKRSKLL